MKKLIITISDDLDIFDSIQAAEAYCEPWLLEPKYNFRAFDQDGNILTASVVQKKGKWLFGLLSNSYESLYLEPSGKKNETQLRSEIINYLGQSMKKDTTRYNDMSVSQLLEILIKERGLTS